MKPRGLSKWEPDVRARQQNVVFPDTATNEARLWKNLISRKWGAMEIVGLGLMSLTLLVGLGAWIVIELRGRDGTLIERIVSAFGTQVVFFSIVAAGLIIGWFVDRSRRSHR